MLKTLGELTICGTSDGFDRFKKIDRLYYIVIDKNYIIILFFKFYYIILFEIISYCINLN